GPAGIGKTTLLAELTARLRTDLTVLAAHAVPAESGLPYGVLATLLNPYLDDVSTLPDAQREAIEIALALRAGESVRALAVCLATPNLLRQVARRGRVVLCVDDVQEIDAASAMVLAYAVRRIVPENAAALFAFRSGSATPAGLLDALPLDTLHHVVGPLVDEKVRELVVQRYGTALAVGRVVTAARGNALAAVEFGKAEVTGQPVTGSRLTDLLRRRMRDQPPPVYDLLVLMAAAGRLPVDVAEELLPGLDDPLSSAVDAEILTNEDVISFAHPLMAEAMADVAGLVAVRAAHRRLAGCHQLSLEQ